jgi:transcriptional regulator with XRE-family HTH domain
MFLANRIRKIRETQKLTQEDAAFICGISASAYGQIERNAHKSTYETLIRIANALNVSFHFLVDINNTQFTENTSYNLLVSNNSNLNVADNNFINKDKPNNAVIK